MTAGVRGGMLSAAKSAAGLVLVPLLLWAALVTLSGDGDRSAVLALEWMERVLPFLLVAGAAMTALSFLVGYYVKGSVERAVCGAVAAICAGAWAWIATWGGAIVIEDDNWRMDIDVAWLVALVILLAALKGAYCIAEWALKRRGLRYG